VGCLTGLLGALISGLVATLCLVAPARAQVSIASQDGKLTIPAYWFKAAAKDKNIDKNTEPRPAVIALHGCNGALDAKGQLNPIWRRYAGYFNAEHMHFVVLDSFSPRGQTSICSTPSNRRTLHEEDRREDVFAAIAWLAQQPTVDATRIIVMGWSHGAQTVLSVVDATDKWVQTQTIQPRAAVAFYPGCVRQLKMWNYALQSPLLVMSGELDDWTLASQCVSLREKVLRGQKDGVASPVFELEVYPDSYHGFDGLGAVRTMENVGNTRSGKATVGGNPAAQKASHARLFEFVAAQVGAPLLLSHEQRLKAPPSPLPK
jgi:dienelactone hydrolase